ncbi:amidohydrolase [Flammeovirga agarivorans]|uniref:Amidohydrolase n=1 Tax=Flammeovirga agarivorans TaxID=2726742 RepID=A0A7X8SH10_9BACT|nr:amidohydrolase [Flammeovirga agarivorans]NLR90105.1 amidohydrolase [Flammeovirga agarivorans]
MTRITTLIITLLIAINSIATEKVNSNTVLYKGGTIVTMEGEAGETAEAVVSIDDKIVFVGTEEKAKALYPKAVEHDLEGKTMFPGFIEQHIHPFLGALTLVMDVIAPEPWDLPTKYWEPAYTPETYKEKLIQIEAEKEDPNEILMTWGYHHNFHGKIDRDYLDEISKDRPILVWHRSVHEMYLNTAMIEHLGLTEQWVEGLNEQLKEQIDFEKGYFIEAGLMLGLLPKIHHLMGSEERMRKGLDQMIKILRKNGVTAFNEPGAFIMPGHHEIYMEMLGAEETPMYSFFIPESKTPYFRHAHEGPEAIVKAVEDITHSFPKEGKVRFFDKHVKLLIDGAIVSQLMMMEDGYLDGHEGEWIQRPETISELFDIFWPLDYQLHVHVNGDKGMNELLRVIERKMEEMPREDHRTTIVHFANSTNGQVERIQKLGCIVSANPYYVTAFSDKYSEVGLGPVRAQAMVRSGEAERRGIPFSLHSDLPIGPSDPLFLAWCAVTRGTLQGNSYRPDLALSLHGAMKGITIEAAYSWRMENELGSIKEGKIANFTILEENPYEVEESHLKDIKIWGTVFEGKCFQN